jgi:SAM-dependent methyltransferase
MSPFYKLQYLIGMTPWGRMPSLPIGRQAFALLDREESGRELPYGRALDLGCGTGYWSVHLAQRGWEVTGVDIVPMAVRTARDRARRAGVEAQFVKGSVTALAAAGIGSGFRLILDFGVVHGLPAEEVRDVAREVTRVAIEDATLMMYAFSPGRRGPCREGSIGKRLNKLMRDGRSFMRKHSIWPGSPVSCRKPNLAFTIFAAADRDDALSA